MFPSAAMPGRLGPEAAVLERICRQLDFVARPVLYRREVGSEAADIGCGQGVGDLSPVAEALTQRDDCAWCGQVLRPYLYRRTGQYRLRTDLHQYRAAQRRDRTHTFGELHGLTRMPAPVLGVERV